MYLQMDKITKETINTKILSIKISVKNINLGGCGLFAYHMFDVLKKKGIESEILLLGSKENPIHIILNLYDGSYLDSNGIFESKLDILRPFCGDKDYILTVIDYHDLEEMLKNVEWNKSFNFYYTDSEFNAKSNWNLLIERINNEFY